MLRELRLRNIAVIEEATLSLEKGLTVLTGETGAGKSIVVDALELVLGGRGSSDLIRSGCEEASVEAAFSIPADTSALKRLQELDIEASDELLVRRIISTTGRNRAYLNGTLVNLSTLVEVTRQLIDIHGQHDHQSLLHPDIQQDLLDAFAGLGPDVAGYREQYAAYTDTQARLQKLIAAERERTQRLDFLSFQAREIESANFVAGEDADLEEERRILANAEKLHFLAEEAYDILYAGDPSGGEPLLKGLKKVSGNMATLAEFDRSLQDAATTAQNSLILTEETALTLRDYKERITVDPDRLGAVEDRIDLFQGLKKKYGETLEGVLGHLATIKGEMATLESVAEEINILEKERITREEALFAMATRLSTKRKEAASVLEQRIQHELAELGMPSTFFKVSFEAWPENGERPRLTVTGFDQSEFFISPNPGEALKPLAKIASGGELSRIMLGLKTILAGEDAVSTLIFDEVDAGIGGRIGDSVGSKLKVISESHQVICVTHLPQVAGHADHHYCINKKVVDGRTFTDVKLLDGRERTEEIARMLGGKEETALKHAGEMLARG